MPSSLSCTITVIDANRIDMHVPPPPTEASHSSVHQSISTTPTTNHFTCMPTTTVKGKWARSQVFRKFLFENFDCLRAYAEWTKDSDDDEDDKDEDESNENNFNKTSARRRENNSNNSTNTSLERSNCDGGAAAAAGSADFDTTTTTCTNIPSTAVATSSSCGTNSGVRARRAHMPYILDVAGGKGDVAIPLKIRGLRCGIVDPRVVDLENTKLMKNVKYHLEDMKGETKTGRAILRRLRQSADLQRAMAMEARADVPSSSSDSAAVLSSSPSVSPFLPSLLQSQSSIQPERLPNLTDQHQHTCHRVELPDIFREWFTSSSPRSGAQEGEDRGIDEERGISLSIGNNKQQPQHQLSRRARRRARAKEVVGATTEVGGATENSDNVREEGASSQTDPPSSSSPLPSSQHVQQYVKAHAESHGLSRAKVMCDIVIGMHPDQATEPIVDFALAHRKLFAIVPCCVFPKENPHRRVAMVRSEMDEKEMATSNGNDLAQQQFSFSQKQNVSPISGGSTANGHYSSQSSSSLTWIPVETYEQFIEYLVQKAPAGVIKRATLPIDGRNIVLYCDSYPPSTTASKGA